MGGRGRALAQLLDPARRIARSGSLEDAFRLSVTTTRGFASDAQGGEPGKEADAAPARPAPPAKELPKPGMGRGGGVAGGESGSLTNQILSRPQGWGRVGGRGGGGRGRGRVGRGGGAGGEGRDRPYAPSPPRSPRAGAAQAVDRRRKFDDPAYAAFAQAGNARRPSRFQQRQNVMEENDGIARLSVQKPAGSRKKQAAPATNADGVDYDVLRQVHHYMEMELDPQWMAHMAVGSLPNMEPRSADKAPEAVLEENKAVMMDLLGVETDTEWKELTGQVLEDFSSWEEAEGRKRVTAGGTREGLSNFEERAAIQSLPEVQGMSDDPQVGDFVRRAASALEKNPRWTFDQKTRFLKMLPRGLQ